MSKLDFIKVGTQVRVKSTKAIVTIDNISGLYIETMEGLFFHFTEIEEITEDKDPLIQLIEDTEPYNQSAPVELFKFSKEQEEAWYMAQLEEENRRIGEEAMYFKGKIVDIPNHLR